MAARPIAVLDANTLVPPGLRDLMLSCASAGVFRPVWQGEIEAELRRNWARLLIRRGVGVDEADDALDHVVAEMDRAFPDARQHPRSWRGLEASMTNHLKDRHVLAAAVAAAATHLVTATRGTSRSGAGRRGWSCSAPRHSCSPSCHRSQTECWLRCGI